MNVQNDIRSRGLKTRPATPVAAVYDAGAEITASPVKTETGKARLNQNPHKLSEPREMNLELAIGRQVRELRKRRRLTGAELARQTGLSVGMLSKVENGLISPSLNSLQALSNALNVPLVQLLEGYEEPREAMHVKAGEAPVVERAGTRAGQQYHLLGHLGANGCGVVTEPYLIVLDSESDRFPTFQHDGVELLYMLEGCVDYRHGDRTYRLEPGDSLLFDADSPHGPENLVQLPARFLSVISYPQAV